MNEKKRKPLKSGSDVETTDRFQYAENVVSESLKPSSAAWFWYGSTTRLVRFFDIFGFRTLWVSLPVFIHFQAL